MVSTMQLPSSYPEPPSTAPPRPRGRPRKLPDARDEGNRRQLVLRAAAQLFRHHGFDATSTRDIAVAAGMHSGSPFYHFKSKNDLLYAVMEEGMRSAIRRQARALQETEHATVHPEGMLKVLIRNHLDVLLGPDSDFVPVMLYESRALSASQREVLAQLRRDYEAAWLPVLDALATSGALRPDVRLARLLMLGALNWSVQWYDPCKGATPEELTTAAMALFLHRT